MSRYLRKASLVQINGKTRSRQDSLTAQGLQHLTLAKDRFLIPSLEVHSLQLAAYKKRGAEPSPLSLQNGSKTHRITTNLERKHLRHNVIPQLDFIAVTHNEQIPGESPSRALLTCSEANWTLLLPAGATTGATQLINHQTR